MNQSYIAFIMIKPKINTLIADREVLIAILRQIRIVFKKIKQNINV